MIRAGLSVLRGARGRDEEGRIAICACLSALDGSDDFNGGTYLDGSGAKRFDMKLSTDSFTLIVSN
jgi:hypothetical protein